MPPVSTGVLRTALVQCPGASTQCTCNPTPMVGFTAGNDGDHHGPGRHGASRRRRDRWLCRPNRRWGHCLAARRRRASRRRLHSGGQSTPLPMPHRHRCKAGGHGQAQAWEQGASLSRCGREPGPWSSGRNVAPRSRPADCWGRCRRRPGTASWTGHTAPARHHPSHWGLAQPTPPGGSGSV